MADEISRNDDDELHFCSVGSVGMVTGSDRGGIDVRS